MTTYNISEIADILNGKLTKNSGGNISSILIDSRKIIFPRESLFFALAGDRNNGHRFIEELYQSGVRNFIIQEKVNIGSFPRANFVKVENTLESLQHFVQFHREKLKTPVIGITGSNGKTIVKEWIYQCLFNEKNIVRNPKSYNSQVGVPLSVWLLNKKADVGVFEAGISKPGEMEKLQKVIQPAIGVFTNIGDAHQENFKSLEQKIIEKLKLFSQAASLIYCKDHTNVSQIIEQYSPKEQSLFSWGYHQESLLKIISTEKTRGKTFISVVFQGEPSEVTIPFTDNASIENAMHVLAVLLILKYPLKKAILKLQKIEPVAMRLEQKEGANNCTIINDSYNSDLESLHIALEFLSNQNQHPKKVLILSDIAQSGFTAGELYKRVAGMVIEKKVDWLIGIGPTVSGFKDLFGLRTDFFKDTHEFIASFPLSKFQDMAILLKGARSFTFERISTLLQKQSHQTVLEIDLNAIEQNLNFFRSLLKPETGIIAMVKAFSYGSGTHELANLLQFQRVAALAVAFTDEGIALRKDGIRLPILVMNPEKNSYEALIDNQLEPEIYDFESLQAFNAIAGKSEIPNYPVHIKLDTGMHRSGFMENEMDALVHELKFCENIRIKSVFSHLAAADEPQQDEFTLQQMREFDQRSQQIMSVFNYKIERHILNSAGIERFPDYQYDKVRLGIGLFGVSASNAKLEQVSTFSSVISQIKSVPAGKTIGYSRKGKFNRDAQIAIVPVGYADGLRRILSNGAGKVWINGKLAPIAGNICMDICMVDVTGIDAKVGDRVELFGKNLAIDTVARWMDTIPYEVLTGISRRVKRTYHLE